MTDISKEDIDNLQKLCRLKLTDKEQELFLANLKKILHYVEQLGEVDTSNVDPCTFVLGAFEKESLREDIVDNSLSEKEFLENAPEQIGSMIRVPTVLK